MSSPAGLFMLHGIEIEAAIVGPDLGVRALAPNLLRALAGTDAWVADAAAGPIGFSNELVAHVVELKNAEPVPSLAGVAADFQAAVRRVNAVLARWDARLLPGGMHPWMDPRAETRLWPHEGAEVYAAYDRIFDCRRHGWANVQSTHLNLPFAGEDEFGRLMAAARALLPVMPALAASSPVADGRPTGLLDARMEHYRTNALKVPAMTGRVVPEPLYDFAAYRRGVFEPLARELAAADPEGTIRGHEWSNARGVIARFDRMALEIRVLDAQECPAADVAVCAAVTAVLRALCEERWVGRADQAAVGDDPLVEQLASCVRLGPRAPLLPELARVLDPGGGAPPTVGALWRRLVEATWDGSDELLPALERILSDGTLAERLLRATGPRPDRARLVEVWTELAACLADGRSFQP